MVSSWEEAWESINEAFERLAHELCSSNAWLWWTCGHLETEVFPFSAYASFSRNGIAGEEDVVISLSFKRSQELLEFTSDLARGDGQLLAIGPESTTDLADDNRALHGWIGSQVEAALSFIQNHNDLLRAELC